MSNTITDQQAIQTLIRDGLAMAIINHLAAEPARPTRRLHVREERTAEQDSIYHTWEAWGAGLDALLRSVARQVVGEGLERLDGTILGAALDACPHIADEDAAEEAAADHRERGGDMWYALDAVARGQGDSVTVRRAVGMLVGAVAGIARDHAHCDIPQWMSALTVALRVEV